MDHAGCLARARFARRTTRRVIIACLAAGFAAAAGAAGLAQSDPAQFLVGTWQSEPFEEAGAEVMTTIEYQSVGRYSGTREVDLGDIGQIIALSGDWAVKPIDGERFVLRLEEDGEARPVTERLRVIDNDTLLSEEAGYELHRIPTRLRDPDAPVYEEQ